MGCNSSSFFLFKNKLNGEFKELHGSHCSCYGFEDQFSLEDTSIEYLKSDNFGFSTGGYDDDEKENNKIKVKEFLKEL